MRKSRRGWPDTQSAAIYIVLHVLVRVQVRVWLTPKQDVHTEYIETGHSHNLTVLFSKSVSFMSARREGKRD